MAAIDPHDEQRRDYHRERVRWQREGTYQVTTTKGPNDYTAPSTVVTAPQPQKESK